MADVFNYFLKLMLEETDLLYKFLSKVSRLLSSTCTYLKPWLELPVLAPCASYWTDSVS